MGFQPRTTPAERRADLDAARQARADITAIYTSPDTFTGPIIVDRDATDPNYISNKTGATNVDGVVHLSIRSNGTEIGRITRATSTTAGYLTTSDEDLKQNLRPIDDELCLLWMRSTEPLLFEYKDRPDVRHVGYIRPTNRRDLAQRHRQRHRHPRPRQHRRPHLRRRRQRNHPLRRVASMDDGPRQTDPRPPRRTPHPRPHHHRTRTHSSTNTPTASPPSKPQVAALIDTDTALDDALEDLRVEIFYTRQMTANWQYSNTVTPPPGAGQMRTNTAITEMYIHPPTTTATTAP